MLAAPAVLLADETGCDPGLTTVPLTGVVRDFREHSLTAGHPDFERDISTGAGLYTGNLDLFLLDGRPMFVGGGNKVSTQARDAAGRPIAPHLCNKRYETGAEITPQALVAILTDNEGFDAFEVSFVSATFDEAGTSSWVYNVRELSTGKDMSHWVLRLPESVAVMSGTTPGWELGLDASSGFYGIKWDVTDAFSEEEFTIVLDQQYVGADSTCVVVAKSGNATDNGDLFAPTATVSPMGTPFQVAGALVDDPTLGDTPAVLGVQSNGGISSAWSFKNWYRDNPPMNMSELLTVNLVRDPGDCVFVFDASTDPYYTAKGGFFPIDGKLYGNSDGTPDHNYHFTYEVSAKFTYDASADQYFRFTGDDDVWVFVDKKLAIDLGGIHGPLDQYVDLSRMGLTDGETYELDMFFAERHRTQSNFRIETNIELMSIDPEIVSAIFD
jgi:fibro-slime domain-containing protein